jgi:hypothetical protein
MNNQAQELLLEIYSIDVMIMMMTSEYNKELDPNTKKRIAWEVYKLKMELKNRRKEYVKACDEQMSNDDLYTWLAGEQVKVDIPKTQG